ncbi:MAG: dTDP-4-dehydrorhamnose 3,5-epimerase [Myxococcales bacterium]|nr:dTDP-4-dehydrorhamnose 3,5-epimerase [Myxococcales bacterium]MCB9671859.1 dTDP-4-dehydrorhamnose 3,5-epimerase [Alphaproteobacteria bacterium]
MQILPTALPEVLVVVPERHTDPRGHVSETWSAARLAGAGLHADFVLDLASVSVHAHTLRGLHFQAPPHGRVKLVRCGRGRMLDVAVDLRSTSPRYGRWVAVELTPENGRQLWIPAGFAHGFVTLEPHTETLYKMSAPWVPEASRAVRFDDPELAIDWTVPHDRLVISTRDAEAPRLRDCPYADVP